MQGPTCLGVTPLHAHTHTHIHTQRHTNSTYRQRQNYRRLFHEGFTYLQTRNALRCFMRAVYLFDVYFRIPIRHLALDRSRHSTHYTVLRVLPIVLFRFSVTRHPLLKVRFPSFGYSARYNAFAFFVILKRKTGRFISAEFG